MPRQARIESPTSYYHIMIRGNNRESIFANDEQKRFLLDVLKKENENQLIEIAAYCFMDNHVHILLKADIANLSIAIKVLNVKFAMNFNQQQGRIGHVFQGRYRSEAVTDEAYLLQVIRYIHNNPVKAKMVKNPGEYNWSSYNEYINDNTIIRAKQKEFVLGCFNHKLNQFIEFHNQKDNNEYLEIKEDIQKERFERAQEIISAYFKDKGLINAKQLTKNSAYLEELIQNLLRESKLTHRQIANLLEISNNIVHKASLEMSY